MVISSFVFLLAFLPIVLLLYYLCPARLRNLVLLVFSLVFYAWGEPVYVLIMLFSIVFDYANGRLLEHFKNKNCPGKAKAALIDDLCGNLAILGFFKYTDFVIGSINSITGAGLSLLHIALPIGISFYTFQTMSYTIDVYRGEVAAQKNILTFATYVTLFPQLIAGPIVQYKTVEKELMHRKVTLEDFSEGAFRFSVGLAKKVLLANQIGWLWESSSQLNHMSGATAWLGAFAYSFQIYFDFSGYSNMAVGLGKTLGFDFPENFDYPYSAHGIRDFWRRWHMSLTGWFREYLYIPLGGNRKGRARQILNTMIVFAATGIWHGANLTFILWGLMHGILMCVETLIFKRRKLKSPAAWLYTIIIVIIGFVIFRADSVGYAFAYIGRMFSFVTEASAMTVTLSVLTPVFIATFTAAVVMMFPVVPAIRRRLDGRPSYAAVNTLCYIAMFGLYFLCVLTLAADSYNPFIYFRF